MEFRSLVPVAELFTVLLFASGKGTEVLNSLGDGLMPKTHEFLSQMRSTWYAYTSIEAHDNYDERSVFIIFV